MIINNLRLDDAYIFLIYLRRFLFIWSLQHAGETYTQEGR